MRALVIPCLWSVAITLLAMAVVVAFGQSVACKPDSPLGVLICQPVVDEMRCAACEGDAATVGRILARRPDLVDTRDADGWTALHEASRAGRTRVVEALLEHGADINAPNNEGDTPLHAAARVGEPGVVRLLTAAGADTNARNNRGQTPMDLAVRSGWKRLAETLRRQGGHAGSSAS